MFRTLTFCFLAGVACAPATTFTYNQTIVLNPGGITASGNGFTYDQKISGNAVDVVSAGDVITGTITFIGGPIRLFEPANASAGLSTLFYFQDPATSDFALFGNSSITSFTGLSGTFGTTNPVSFGTSGGAIGVGLLDSSGSAFDFSFTGLTYSANINSVRLNFVPAAVPVHLSEFQLQAQQIQFGSAAPEPASFALMATGVLGLIGVLRRRASKCSA